MSCIENFRKAREMVLAPGELFELTKIEREGVEILDFKNGP